MLLLAETSRHVEVDESCTSTAPHCAENEEEEKSLVQSVSERIAQSAQSVKEAVTGSTGEDGMPKRC